MKRIVCLLIALMLVLPCAFAEEDDWMNADPMVYPGIVAPIKEGYELNVLKGTKGTVIPEQGVKLRADTSKSAAVLVIIPQDVEVIVLQEYPEGWLRVRCDLGNGFYTGYVWNYHGKLISFEEDPS